MICRIKTRSYLEVGFIYKTSNPVKNWKIFTQIRFGNQTLLMILKTCTVIEIKHPNNLIQNPAGNLPTTQNTKQLFNQ
jgi:hypothetical protein